MESPNIYKPADFKGLSVQLGTLMSGWLLLGTGSVAYFISFLIPYHGVAMLGFLFLIMSAVTVKMQGCLELAIFAVSVNVFSFCVLFTQIAGITEIFARFKNNCAVGDSNCHELERTPGTITYLIAYATLAFAIVVQIPCFFFFCSQLAYHRWQFRNIPLISKLPAIASRSIATQTINKYDQLEEEKSSFVLKSEEETSQYYN